MPGSSPGMTGWKSSAVGTANPTGAYYLLISQANLTAPLIGSAIGQIESPGFGGLGSGHRQAGRLIGAALREDAQDEKAHDASRCDARPGARRLHARSCLGGTRPWRSWRHGGGHWHGGALTGAAATLGAAVAVGMAAGAAIAAGTAIAAGAVTAGVGAAGGAQASPSLSAAMAAAAGPRAYGYYPCRYRWGY